MKTDRLQLLLIPDLQLQAQPLPNDARQKSLELIATMVLRVVDRDGTKAEAAEGRDERR